jgi:hypothetical protein
MPSGFVGWRDGGAQVLDIDGLGAVRHGTCGWFMRMSVGVSSENGMTQIGYARGSGYYPEPFYYVTRDLLLFVADLTKGNTVKGIAIGRFQYASEINAELLIQIIKSKKELNHIPVVANVDSEHTQPMITLPIGEEVEVVVSKTGSTLKIMRHWRGAVGIDPSSSRETSSCPRTSGKTTLLFP